MTETTPTRKKIIKGVPRIYSKHNRDRHNRKRNQYAITPALYRKLGEPEAVCIFVAETGTGLQMLVVDKRVLQATGEYERYAAGNCIEARLRPRKGGLPGHTLAQTGTPNHRPQPGEWISTYLHNESYVPVEYTRGGALFNL